MSCTTDHFSDESDVIPEFFVMKGAGSKWIIKLGVFWGSLLCADVSKLLLISQAQCCSLRAPRTDVHYTVVSAQKWLLHKLRTRSFDGSDFWSGLWADGCCRWVRAGCTQQAWRGNPHSKSEELGCCLQCARLLCNCVRCWPYRRASPSIPKYASNSKKIAAVTPANGHFRSSLTLCCLRLVEQQLCILSPPLWIKTQQDWEEMWSNSIIHWAVFACSSQDQRKSDTVLEKQNAQHPNSYMWSES